MIVSTKDKNVKISTNKIYNYFPNIDVGISD